MTPSTQTIYISMYSIQKSKSMYRRLTSKCWRCRPLAYIFTRKNPPEIKLYTDFASVLSMEALSAPPDRESGRDAAVSDVEAIEASLDMQ